MSQEKISDLMFKSRGKKSIKLAGVFVNTSGPRGIRSSCRPESAMEAPTKYSNIGLILDEIFLNGSIEGRENVETSSIYTKFEYQSPSDSGTTKVYEAIYDGNEINWLSAEPNGYMKLVPIVLYTISSSNTGDNAEELKGYFKEIKETKDKTSVLLFCDAFYYSFAKLPEKSIVESNYNPELKEMVHNALDTGLYKPIDLLSGLSTKILTATEISNEEIEEKEEDFTVEYDGWNDEQKSKIPPKKFLDTFVMTPETLSIARKVKFRTDKVIKRLKEGKQGLDAIGSDYINLLMVGRPSTGKTTIAQAVAAMTGMPIYTVPFSKHTEEDTVEGKNKVVEGKIGFVETEFLKAYEQGGIIVCEEINLADPGVVMGSMGQAIEKPFVLMKDGYIPVRRHPLCIIIGTMNTGTAGSKQLNQALSSRFKATYTLEDPDKNTFISILAAQGYQKKKCKYVYDAYNNIIKFLKDPKQSQEELCENITMRGCFGALECMEEGQSYKEALNNTLVGKIAEVDLEVAKQVRDEVIDSLPDRI